MVLTVRLSEGTEARLERLAKRTGRTKSFYAREAVEHFLDELEEMFWAQEAVATWEASDKQTISAEEFEAKYGL
ncbi:MAG: TraY domain-containing protein [Propionibacteriaceae bacterium]|jgi:RHH-type rel operon transcriptional repressor/antitoxin RelB|nr:TraY domain-containing protein [Propionibacteriaceae bacterium]